MLAAFSHISDLLTDQMYDPTDIKVEEKDLRLRYTENDSLHPVIRAFSPTVVVKGKPFIKVEGNYLVNFFAPGDSVEDPLFALLFISLAIIFLFRIKKISRIDIDKPFTSQMVIGIKWAGICCLVFALLDYLRLYLINNYIKDVTDNIYHLERFTFFSSTFAWAGLLLSWLYRILRKAEVLQIEQELTV